MLWNASALNGYPIKATDGQLGTVAGMMYDDSDWAIRWLVVETGDWLNSRWALLPVGVLGQPDAKLHHLPVSLTMRQVKEHPDITVGEWPRETEVLVCEHHDLPHGRDHFLWGGHDGKPADGIARGSLEGLATAEPEGRRRESRVVRISEITGDSVEATDGDIGHAEDFLIDTALWQVRSLVVHTSRWWPGQKLLVSPLSIHWIDWARSIIHLDMTCLKVKESPRYVAGETADGAYEESLHTEGIRWTRR